MAICSRAATTRRNWRRRRRPSWRDKSPDKPPGRGAGSDPGPFALWDSPPPWRTHQRASYLLLERTRNAKGDRKSYFLSPYILTWSAEAPHNARVSKYAWV